MEVGSELTMVRSKRVVLNSRTCPADIVIKGGKIVEILTDGRTSAQTPREKILDVGDLVVMAGIVDSHVHVNEPGRTDWEGYWTATKSAAAGGITTIVDMPLNSIPPTTTLENFQMKLQMARGQCFVDTAFWGGVIPGNQSALLPMIKAGVPGFKCFLIHSGVDEFPHVAEVDLEAAMAELQGTGCVLLFHAEKELERVNPPIHSEAPDPRDYTTFLNSRTDDMELEAIRIVIKLCFQYRVHCHIVHLSSAEAVPIIQEARKAGAPLTVETTHHYLSLAAEEIPTGATHYKCCPPIRGRCNQEKLWSALKAGIIDMVVSDHSPCTADLKRLETGDFMTAWGGISSLQFGLPLFWTAARQRGFTLHDTVNLMCKNTAKLCGIEDRKGSLAPGKDADLVVWNPDKEFEVKESIIYHKNKLTPYLGRRLYGEVFITIVRGNIVYLQGQFPTLPSGEHILVNANSAT
ncbi:zgc:103559 isoform X1 [Callorhinchus milii]|uniref:zgc:103559 isoform X1 n=1 Tax=Callorhinchus milii TaxID=7868 RepID=UPI0004575DDD|nr:zgc:103559 isoform X1 [Callorhinchus milii]|eukprot:gi/632934283/ref/XP_007906082.1/ PREDICTED: allantoinase, mitochondrial-like isoform X1 [Callorhinchus milii]